MNHSRDFSIGLNELAYVYDFTTFWEFPLSVEGKSLLVSPCVEIQAKHNDGAWKGKYFFILPQSWVRKGGTSCFYIEDLDIHFSYLF